MIAFERVAAAGNGLCEEIAVNLRHAHLALQGLLALLAACPPGTALEAAQLHALLCLPADEVAQATQMAALLCGPGDDG